MLEWCCIVVIIIYLSYHAFYVRAWHGGTVKDKYSSFYVINIVFQSIFTLLWHIGAGLLVGWIFIRFFSAETWVYVPLIIAGVFTGLFSMVRFILAAMKALERIEEDRRKKKKLEEKQNGK